MTTQILKRNIFQRILGIPATRPPRDKACWSFSEGRLEIDLDRAPELEKPGGAVRLEQKNLPHRILVVHDNDNQYFAFRNRCRHMGRRLDPVPDTRTVQCCSVNKTTYDYQGRVLQGPARKELEVFPVVLEGRRLIIRI